MGRWRGATFKEYIREELACYARNMSRDMKRKFNFVNIAGNAFTDIPDDTLHIIENDYRTTRQQLKGQYNNNIPRML
jgi:hypothetical protein